ncbi:platelet glycoprotein VI-like [Gracilinanus agilis]|uniref:platelet glycoprotein VI-like n=1 Tax=Gracilinanus agilis TaxID=191870 RepID=UPI001CFCDF34|nr:platelet glycoprotein VI-like [Gracilinanus agilis]
MFRLERLGTSDDYRDQPGLPGPRSQARFSLGSASATVSGKYRCSYRNGSYWSKPSNQLELVVTGLYDKPSFSVQPGPAVLFGKSATFSCESQFGFNMFAIAKEGRAGIWKTQEGKSPVRFPILSATADHAGTYRCYAFDSHFPYLWTAPSEPLELTVTVQIRSESRSPLSHLPFLSGKLHFLIHKHEGAGPRNLSESFPTALGEEPRLGTLPLSLPFLSSPFPGAPSSPHISPEKVDISMGLTSQDYTVPNLVRLVLAGLVVAALGGLLAEAWQAWREEFQPLSGALIQGGSPVSPQTAKGSPP